MNRATKASIWNLQQKNLKKATRAQRDALSEHVHGLAAEVRPVLVKRSPMKNFGFEGIIDFFEELYHQSAKNKLWGNAVGEQLI